MSNTFDDGRVQKPAVTREEYDRARAVLDVLPAGIYIKCAHCRQFKTGGEFTMSEAGVFCEVCRSHA